MEFTLVAYMPMEGKSDPEWVAHLPPHMLVRSREGLQKAMELPKQWGRTYVLLLRPRLVEDLEYLAARAELYASWRVVLELPDERRESLQLAQALSPRYFTFRDSNPEYMVEVIRKMVEQQANSI